MTLSGKINEAVKKSGLVELVKADAILLKETYAKMDEADNNNDMDLWESLCDKTDEIKNTIINKVKAFLPSEISEESVVRNFTAAAIDLAAFAK
jgi:hypothetical protein